VTSNRASHEASDSTSALPLTWVEVFRDGKDATAKSGSGSIYFGLGERQREKG